MMRRPRHTAVLVLLAFNTITTSITSVLATTAGAAPLYVALVKVSELAPYTLSTAAATSAAAAWRAAGYPAAKFLSKAPLARAKDGPQDPPAPVTELAAAVPVGPGGPTLEPFSQNTSSAAARRLQQLTDHGLQGGFEGTTSAASAGTVALAVGPKHIVQVAGSVLTITNISSSGNHIAGSSKSVALLAVMAGAAADCDDVFDPSAVFDHTAGRYLVSATCGGQGRVLLAASANSDPSSNWFVYGLVADGVNTSLACTVPVRESAVVDYTQISYNSDGIFITYKSLCPSDTTNSGVGILALPKYAVYKGMPNFLYPIYTSGDLQQALADGTTSYAGKGCTQMAPVVPQGAADVPDGEAYFVCKDVSVRAASAGQQAVVAALLDTAALWQYGGPESQTNAPLLAARLVQLGDWRSPLTGVGLLQPQGAPALQLGSHFREFWNGAAVLAHGKLYLATSTAVLDSSTPAYNRRPAIAWAEVSVTPSVAGTDSCPQSQAGVKARESFDWLKDYSWNWGAEFDLNYTQHPNVSFAPRLKSIAHYGYGGSSHSMLSHDGPLAGAARLAIIGAGALAAADTLYGGEPCSCYRCYWGGAYYRYGGYNGGALSSQGFGYSSSGYYFAQGQMTRCQSTCTRCWYYGYPGHGFGNVGDDVNDPIPRANYGIRSVQGQLTPDAESGSAQPTLDGPTLDVPSLSIRTVPGVDFATLFTPCNRSARLAVTVTRHALISQGGEHALGLVYPALAVGQGGELLLVYTQAGPGNTSQGLPAYPGVGSVLIRPDGDVKPQTVKAGKSSIVPAAAAGAKVFGAAAAQMAAGWGELSAAAVQGSSGSIFTVVHYAGAAQPTSIVSSWISTWLL